MKMNFNEKLTSLRKQKGLSQEELGEKLNVTRQTISKWELGQTSPDTNKLTEIANFFEVSVNDLTNSEEIKIKEYNTKEERKTPVVAIIGIILLVLVLLSVIIYATWSAIVGIFFKKASDMQDEMINNSKTIDERRQSYMNNLDTVFEDSQFEDISKTAENFINSVRDEIDTEYNKQKIQEQVNSVQEMQKEQMEKMESKMTEEQKKLMQDAQARQQELLQQMR